MIRGSLRRLVAASVLVALSVYGVNAATAYQQTVHRSSAFATQATDWYCTAATVQNVRNLALDMSKLWPSEQAAMYAFGRSKNRHAYSTKGVDPQGVEAMLEKYIPGSNWAQVRTRSLQGVLTIAARRMRATGLAAVLFVGGGKHTWTMNGYVASADPATASSFRVTHVRFSGPFYPKQVRLYGWYDLPPNTLRTVESFANAFFPYSNSLAFGYVRSTIWNGYHVAVVPVSGPGGPDPTPTPTPTPSPTSQPTSAPTAAPTLPAG